MADKINKFQINNEHPRIKNRSSEEQKYRDSLANALKQTKKPGIMRYKKSEYQERQEFKGKLSEDDISKQKIKQRFLFCIENRRLEEAVKIKKHFGKQIDFTEDIKKGFDFWLEKMSGNAVLIENLFGEGIDFPETLNYKEYKFRYFLKEGNIDKTKKIKEELGEKLDLSKFIEEIKHGFWSCLVDSFNSWGNIDKAREFREAFGKQIDFKEEIKAAFTYCLEKGEIELAEDIKICFGNDVAFDIVK